MNNIELIILGLKLVTNLNNPEKMEEFIKLNVEFKKRFEEGMKKCFNLLKRLKYEKNKSYFKERYHNDPYFKKRHKKFMLTRVNCKVCNKMIARNYMSAHHRTRKCLEAKLKGVKPENINNPEHMNFLDDLTKFVIKRIKNTSLDING